MTVLKFRVMYEEDDTIYRDIEIKPSQTLEDFESVIISSYNLPANAAGQFYLSNDNWQKVKKIHPAPVVEEKKGRTRAKAKAFPVLVAFIDDPHQHFIYDYTGSKEFIFLIELMSLSGVEKGAVAYPVLVRSQGPSPFKKEELMGHYAKRVVVPEEAAVEEEEEDEDEEDEVSPFVGSDEEPDIEDLAELGEEKGGDLMEGDSIESDVAEESEAPDFINSDDFDPEDLNESPGEEYDEEDLR